MYTYFLGGRTSFLKRKYKYLYSLLVWGQYMGILRYESILVAGYSFKRTYQYFIVKKYQKENINIFIIVCWREDNGTRRKSEHLWPSLSVDMDGAWQTICKSQNQKYAKSQKKYARTQNHICEGLSRCCRKKSPFCHQKSDAEKIRKVVFESAPKRISKFE